MYLFRNNYAKKLFLFSPKYQEFFYLAIRLMAKPPPGAS